jgi:predicted negative regulator of RcsB-dependent stress response
MIKSLRKRHLQIWIVWAVLLPLGIVIAWKAVPKKVTQQLLQAPTSKTSAFQIKPADTLKLK